jgi:hypothetical protein
MNHISRLNCRIQVAGQADAAYQLGARLETEFQQRIAEVYSAELDQAFEGDPSVYVIRNLRLRLDTALQNQETSTFVQHVARKMAIAVRRKALLGEDTVRFANQADYKAHFIADLLRGQAWDSWIYDSFREYRYLPLKESLRKVLLEDPQILGETLVHLRELGYLDPLLRSLPQNIQMELWDQLYGREPRGEEPLPEAWRPFYASAVNLLNDLGLLEGEPPSLETVLHGLPGNLPNQIDWLDKQALASALMEILKLLDRQGYVQASEEYRFEGERLAALEALDWLDQEYLKKELLKWLPVVGLSQGDSSMGSRPSIATPRQSKCLADLLAALQLHELGLDTRRPGSAENALRLITALLASAPQWQNDPLPLLLIAQLLAAWETLSHAYEPALVLLALQQGNLDKALAYLPQVSQDQGRNTFRDLLKLGQPAISILAAISKVETSSPGHFPFVETRCAGVALLFRAVIDARLPFLLKNNDFPDPSLSAEEKLQEVLLRCFESWAGAQEENASSAPLQDNPIHDPGFRILAGVEVDSETIHASHEFSLSDLSTFRQTWEEHLAGLRLSSTGDLADNLLRLWARWLRGFADASVPFLLQNFIHRPGTIFIGPTEIKVEMERRSLDIVLEMADYLAPIENISWLGGRRLSFSLSPD